MMHITIKNKPNTVLSDTNFNENTDSLFRLVHSLSKAEKRSFKMLFDTPNHKKQFVILFNLIERQKNYDEDKIKRVKGITLGQLPNLKIQLYSKILEALNFSSNSSKASFTVNNAIANAMVLYNRCMYSDCQKQLDKARRLAHKYDLVTSLIEINNLQQRCLRLTANENNQSVVDSLRSEMTILSRRIRIINCLAALSLKLNSMYVQIGSTRNKLELNRIKEYMSRYMKGLNLSKSGFEEQSNYFQAMTGYYFFVRNYQTSKKFANQWVHLHDSNVIIKYQRTESYIRALNALLVAQNKLADHDGFVFTQKKLVGIKRDKNFNLDRNLNLQLFKAIYIHQMNRHFMSGEFKAGTRIVSRHQQEIKRFLPLLDLQNQLLFCYKIACLYLGAGQFRQSLTWLNKITMSKAIHVREDIQSFARILRLICYFELKDDYGVQSNIRSTYRFLLSRKNYGQYENLIIRFLKNLSGNETQTELTDSFMILQKQMLHISKLKYEKRAFIYFDMIAWLESKIQNKPIQEVFQNRLKKGIRYEF